MSLCAAPRMRSLLTQVDRSMRGNGFPPGDAFPNKLAGQEHWYRGMPAEDAALKYSPSCQLIL